MQNPLQSASPRREQDQLPDPPYQKKPTWETGSGARGARGAGLSLTKMWACVYVGCNWAWERWGRVEAVAWVTALCVGVFVCVLECMLRASKTGVEWDDDGPTGFLFSPWPGLEHLNTVMEVKGEGTRNLCACVCVSLGAFLPNEEEEWYDGLRGGCKYVTLFSLIKWRWRLGSHLKIMDVGQRSTYQEGLLLVSNLLLLASLQR